MGRVRVCRRLPSFRPEKFEPTAWRQSFRCVPDPCLGPLPVIARHNGSWCIGLVDQGIARRLRVGQCLMVACRMRLSRWSPVGLQKQEKKKEGLDSIDKKTGGTPITGVIMAKLPAACFLFMHGAVKRHRHVPSRKMRTCRGCNRPLPTNLGDPG